MPQAASLQRSVPTLENPASPNPTKQSPTAACKNSGYADKSGRGREQTTRRLVKRLNLSKAEKGDL